MSSKSKTMLKETKKALTKKLFSSQDETHKEAKRDLKERANKEKIENVFSTINNKKFSHLETNKDFLEKFKEIENFLSKEEYEDMAQLERVYSLFNPSLYLAWERMYLFKFLNEIDISDSSSIATCLFLELTNALLSGTDGSESCRRDTFTFKNGKIIELVFFEVIIFFMSSLYVSIYYTSTAL